MRPPRRACAKQRWARQPVLPVLLAQPTVWAKIFLRAPLALLLARQRRRKARLRQEQAPSTLQCLPQLSLRLPMSRWPLVNTPPSSVLVFSHSFLFLMVESSSNLNWPLLISLCIAACWFVQFVGHCYLCLSRRAQLPVWNHRCRLRRASSRHRPRRSDYRRRRRVRRSEFVFGRLRRRRGASCEPVGRFLNRFCAGTVIARVQLEKTVYRVCQHFGTERWQERSVLERQHTKRRSSRLRQHSHGINVLFFVMAHGCPAALECRGVWCAQSFR